MDKKLEYLRNSHFEMEKNPMGEFHVMKAKVYIKERVPEHVRVKDCFEHVLGKIPKLFYRNVEKFVIGQFNFLKKREIDALYKDRTIYLTNLQESDETLIADIIHEIAHSFEEENFKYIYDDKTIEDEFISKRHSLFEILKAEKLIPKEIKIEKFYETGYNSEFDQMLYKEIGYNKLHNLTKEIFISPYGATSLREYFANAFENFFVKDIFIVNKYCPNVYKKIVNLLEF